MCLLAFVENADKSSAHPDLSALRMTGTMQAISRISSDLTFGGPPSVARTIEVEGRSASNCLLRRYGEAQPPFIGSVSAVHGGEVLFMSGRGNLDRRAAGAAPPLRARSAGGIAAEFWAW